MRPSLDPQVSVGLAGSTVLALARHSSVTGAMGDLAQARTASTGPAAIGAAICRALASAGAIGAWRTSGSMRPRRSSWAWPSVSWPGILIDVADAEAWDRGIAAFTAATGRLDILVNNAATHTQALVEEMSDEDWHRVMRTNADLVFFGCRAAGAGHAGRRSRRRHRERRDRAVRRPVLVRVHGPRSSWSRASAAAWPSRSRATGSV